MTHIKAIRAHLTKVCAGCNQRGSCDPNVETQSTCATRQALWHLRCVEVGKP